MDAQVVSLLGVEFLASKEMGGKHHMLKDLWKYNFYVNMNKHNHYFVFLVQRQQFWHIIFWWRLTITKDFQDSVFACESSIPSTNHSWIACMTNIVIVTLKKNIVIVKLQKISLSKPNVKLPLGMTWTYNFSFIILNLFNNLLIGYKWSTRVNDRLLQKDISEDQTSS